MREMSTSFRLKQVTGDLTLYLSGWSQHRLQPTFSIDKNNGLIWIDDAKFSRWKIAHQSMEWEFITLEKEFMPEPRDRRKERWLREERKMKGQSA